MKIGVVVHGPNIIDSGCALKIINLLKEFGEVKCRLGGTMGRTAVIDASLENIIDISSKLFPSESIRLFKQEEMDIIFLLNYGKSSITGHAFGFKVFKNSFLSSENQKKYFESLNIDNYNDNNNQDHYNQNNDKNYYLNEKSQDNITLIQIERPGEDDGSVIEWSRKSSELTYKIANTLDLKVLKPETIIKKYFSKELSNLLGKSAKEIAIEDSLQDRGSEYSKEIAIEDSLQDRGSEYSKEIAIEDSLQLEESNKIRNIHGVSPNENIFVNGVVIGKSTDEELSLIAKNDYIIDIIGGTIKDHGIEKLGKVDIDKAIVKTGLLRKSTPKPRIIANDEETNLPISGNFNKNFLKVAIIDHAAYDIYNLKSTDLVVTIGDDTTLVASDILFRFNIPVIGITDGDLDKVVEKGFKAEGSIIIELEPGLDDIAGQLIFKKIFNSKNIIKIDLNMNEDNYLNKDELKIEKIEDFKNQIFNIIINNISSKYKIKE